MLRTAQAIGGVLPVLYTFFDEEGRIRLDGFDHQVGHCIENGAQGVVLFGFVTQFYRLAFEEKLTIIDTTARALKGRGSLGVTVMETTIEGQIALVRSAEAAGADWIILQPPLGPPSVPKLWLQMIEKVAAATNLPVAIQNAIVAGTTLSIEELIGLQDRCPNICLCKAETASEDVARFAREHGDRFRVITGNWGVEYLFHRANGAHGLIPAPNFVAEQVAIHRDTEPGIRNMTVPLAQHARILPLMQFIRERPPVEAQLILGKYAYQWRTGYKAGGNRLPGPQTIDPGVRAHLDILCDALWPVH